MAQFSSNKKREVQLKARLTFILHTHKVSIGRIIYFQSHSKLLDQIISIERFTCFTLGGNFDHG